MCLAVEETWRSEGPCLAQQLVGPCLAQQEPYSCHYFELHQKAFFDDRWLNHPGPLLYPHVCAQGLFLLYVRMER